MFSILRIVIDEFRRMFALSIFIMLTLALITGCQTAATKKGQWIMSNLQASTQRAKACSEHILNKPAYQGVFSHLPRSKDITPMHMADTSRPTKEDVKNIIAISSVRLI